MFKFKLFYTEISAFFHAGLNHFTQRIIIVWLLFFCQLFFTMALLHLTVFFINIEHILVVIILRCNGHVLFFSAAFLMLTAILHVLWFVMQVVDAYICACVCVCM